MNDPDHADEDALGISDTGTISSGSPIDGFQAGDTGPMHILVKALDEVAIGHLDEANAFITERTSSLRRISRADAIDIAAECLDRYRIKNR